MCLNLPLGVAYRVCRCDTLRGGQISRRLPELCSSWKLVSQAGKQSSRQAVVCGHVTAAGSMTRRSCSGTALCVSPIASLSLSALNLQCTPQAAVTGDIGLPGSCFQHHRVLPHRDAHQWSETQPVLRQEVLRSYSASLF